MRRTATSAILGLLAAIPFGEAGVAKDIVGRYGFAGEWSIKATLTETANTWYGSRLWLGTASTRHTGLCSANGNPEDTGTITLRTSAVGRATVTLKVGQLDCVYVGRLRKTDTILASCQNGLELPMTLWEEDRTVAERGKP